LPRSSRADSSGDNSKIGKTAAVSPDRLIEMMMDPLEPAAITLIMDKTGISAGTVSYWKMKLPGFKKRYSDAMKIMKKKKPGAIIKKPHANTKTGWESDFEEAYAVTGRFNYSCDVAGIHRDTVQSRLNPESTTYDEAFATRFKDLEKNVDRSLIDVAHKRALESESDSMIKFLLATRMPETFGHKVTHQNVLSATIEYKVIEEKAAKFLEEVFGPVIEGEIIESASQPKRLPAAV
jgi:hypothetical protein